MRIELGTTEFTDGAFITQNNAHYALPSSEKQNVSMKYGTVITVLMYNLKRGLTFDTSLHGPS
jgi:hypothetical protein